MAREESKWVKRAYACFLGVGFTFLLGELADVIIFVLPPSLAELVGAMLVQFVGIPLILVTTVIYAVGLGLSLMLWREWPLIFMSLVSIVVLARNALWPEFCGNVWTTALCAEASYAVSTIIFLSCSLWFFLFKKTFVSAWRIMSTGVLASIFWILALYAVGYQSISDAISIIASTDEPGCVSSYPPAITDECGTHVARAIRQLRLFIRFAALFPVLLLGRGVARSWVRGP